MYIKLTSLFIIILLTFGVTTNINADTTFDSDIQSKLARYKAKKKLEWSKLPGNERALRMRQREFPGFGSTPGMTPCGAIDLGNVPNASRSQGGRAITVIIDGDVINADNHCR